MQSTDDRPEWAKDAVYVGTTIHFDWRDRMRVLFGKPVEIHTRTWTEEKPGRVETDNVRINADRIFPQRRQLPYYVEVEIPKEPLTVE